MGDDEIKKEQPKGSVKEFRDQMKDDHLKRYQKKNAEEMTDEEKKEEEELRALNNGPTSDENRSCQDLLCCLFFLAFIGGCAVVTGIGFKDGNPTALTYIYDEDGRPCGKSGTVVADYPYLYLYKAVTSVKNLDTKFASQGICIKNCPRSFSQTTLDCYPSTNNTNCKVEKENVFLSEPWLEKLCIPSYDLYTEAKRNVTTTGLSVSEKNKTSAELDSEYTALGGLVNTNFINSDKLFDYLGDCITVWPIFIACVGIALVAGFCYLFIIRICGGVIAYIVIFAILAVLVILGWVFQNRMKIYENLNDDTYKNIMLAFAIVFYSLAFIWLLIILCSCNKIRLAIAITEVAAIFVWKVMSVLLVPLIMFIVVSLYLAYWIALSVFIYSAGEVTKSSTSFLWEVKW
jgi:choline transporter-like protein 2/4/5